MQLHIAALALAASLSAPALAGEVWTVSDTGVGADFLLIQDAIDAASDGDTVLIQPGYYSAQGDIVVNDKALSIVVDGAGSAEGFASITVRNLAFDKSAYIVGMREDPHAVDCLGEVVFERCGDSSYAQGTVTDCARVTFVDCTFRGVTGWPGTAGLVVSGSNVTLYDSTSQGGAGGDDLCLGTAGDGGPGIEVLNGSTVRAVQTDFIGGPGGWICSSQTGLDGPASFVDGSSQLVVQTTPTMRLIGPDVVREGDSFNLRIQGPPGDFAYLLTSTELQYRVLPPSVGILHAAVPFDFAAAGTIPASGLLTVPFSAPDLAPGDESRVRYVQSFLTGGGARYLTGPKPLVVIDDSF